MIGYLTKLKIDERKELIDLVNEKSGITGVALEKDWWVTITLKALFNSEYSKYIVFKGGTSLSKCYKLIDRFSEDIDIVIDPNAFGWEYETEPSNSFVKRLKRAGSEFTRTELLESIKKELDKIGVPENEYEILAKEIDPKMPDIDPQILYINYKSIFDY